MADSDLKLKGILILQYRKDEDMAAAGLGVARQTAAHFAQLAADKARENVQIGKGPGPHPHRTDHKFHWVDSGLLEHAIHVEENPRVPNGVAEAQVIVDPIDTPDRGVVNYGVYLEFGWVPVLPSGATGHFTRYPFLAPAIAEVTAHLQQDVPIIYRNLFDTASKSGKVNVELMKVDPSVVGEDEIRNKFRKG
jgi:hypothetical protein